MIKLLFSLLCANILIQRTRWRINVNSQQVTIGEVGITEYLYTNNSLWEELEIHISTKENILTKLNSKTYGKRG